MFNLEVMLFLLFFVCELTFMAVGLKRGGIGVLKKLLSSLSAIVVAFVLSGRVTDFVWVRFGLQKLADTYLKNALESLVSGVKYSNFVTFQQNQLSAIKSVSKVLDLSGTKYADSISSLAVSKSVSANFALTTLQPLVHSIEKLFVLAVVFLILYIACYVVFSSLIEFISKVMKVVPVASQLNSMLGLILGAIQGFIAFVVISTIGYFAVCLNIIK